MESYSKKTLLFAAVCLSQLLSVLADGIYTHDSTFHPDHVLRVSERNISVACESRYSVVVNGTSPGPPLRLKAGKTSWIRVYNDMSNNNLTMVSQYCYKCIVRRSGVN
jgi:L-ascorbate oxidase